MNCSRKRPGCCFNWNHRRQRAAFLVLCIFGGQHICQVVLTVYLQPTRLQLKSKCCDLLSMMLLISCPHLSMWKRCCFRGCTGIKFCFQIKLCADKYSCGICSFVWKQMAAVCFNLAQSINSSMIDVSNLCLNRYLLLFHKFSDNNLCNILGT